MPAAVVVLRIHGQADPALDLDTSTNACIRSAPLDPRHSANASNAWIHGRTGMNCERMRIVEIQHVKADSVHQGGVEDVAAFVATEQGGLRSAPEGRDGSYRPLHCFVSSTADRATKPVQQRSLRFVPHLAWNVFVARGRDVARENLGRADDPFTYEGRVSIAVVIR